MAQSQIAGRVAVVPRQPALDGLRALAVVLVVAGHAYVPHLRLGGVIGVTVFFTLSGYLITLLLLTEYARSDTIALGAFFVRRALRLVPAFLVVVATVGVYTAARGLPLGEYARNALPALAYVANYVRMSGHDLGPFGHTWTLAVEEQFYLLWPLLLLLLLRSRLAGWVVRLLGAVIVGSLFLRYWFIDDYMRSHDGLDVNAYALALGALVALLVQRGAQLPTIPAWVGLTGIALSLAPQPSTPEAIFPLSVAVSPLAAFATAALLVSVSQTGGPAVLRTAPMRWLGGLSYGIYLWHYPLLILFPPTSWSDQALLAGVAVGVAALSRHVVELPALRLKRRFTTVSVPDVAPPQLRRPLTDEQVRWSAGSGECPQTVRPAPLTPWAVGPATSPLSRVHLPVPAPRAPAVETHAPGELVIGQRSRSDQAVSSTHTGVAH